MMMKSNKSYIAVPLIILLVSVQLVLSLGVLALAVWVVKLVWNI